MATDVLTATVAAPPSSHRPFPRGLAISDLDLRDGRYPVLSSHHVAVQQGVPSPDTIPSHTPFYTDAVHQAVRGPSLPPSDLPPYNMNMSSPKLASPQLQVLDDRGLVQLPSHQSTPLNPGSPPASFPPDHKGVNEINFSLFGPSQASQTSSGEANKVPPAAGDPSLPSQQLPPPQPVLPWQTTPQDPQLPEPYTPSPRSGAAAGQTQSVALPSPLSPGMRISGAAQYSPAMTGPVLSSNPRVQAQQPTYITPPSAPKPVFTQPIPPEEVCVECAMRDQDMADVDVTSPGIWARESDVHYEDLLRRELEEEAMGVPPQELQRPRARGGRLTEANLKLWLTLVRLISPFRFPWPVLTDLHSVEPQRTCLEKRS